MPEPVLFAGPTTWGLASGLIADAGVRLRPPVRREDVTRLVGDSAPGVMIVCDGTFQVTPAVSHRELCQAIDAGWQVWGVSSLGAIRAHELRHEGMRGFGDVHALFERLDDFADDEMCLLHCPEPPYFPVTEPLVNVRYALERRGPELGIDEASSQAVIDTLRDLWFGDRTVQRIRLALIQEGGMKPDNADLLLNWLNSHRLKTLDLARLLAMQPWLDTHALAETP
jgi:hypothetical protein